MTYVQHALIWGNEKLKSQEERRKEATVEAAKNGFPYQIHARLDKEFWSDVTLQQIDEIAEKYDEPEWGAFYLGDSIGLYVFKCKKLATEVKLTLEA